MNQIPSFDHGGEGVPLHFLHANGYPPDCYKPLLELLKTQYHVFGMKLRPLWDGSKPEDLEDWHPLSDDLLQFLASTHAQRGEACHWGWSFHWWDCHPAGGAARP